MLKRLPFLCAALLALAACSHDNNTGDAAQPAAPTASSSVATTPAAASTAPASAMTANAPAAAASAATTTDNTPPANAAPAVAAAPFVDDGKWVEGKDYVRIEPAQPKLTGTSKIEVVEVFSYGCPACNAYHGTMNAMVKEMPSDAVVAFLPASFMPQENWVTLQRAYLTAQVFGAADKANDAMYAAVWDTRELSSENPNGGGLKPREALPTIEDMAKIYAKFGVDPKEFVATASSFTINTKMKRADELVKAYGVEGTPTLIIDGKYRVNPLKLGDLSKSIALTKWLVSKEAAGK
ncbi:thiol:disulfide interchange protein DsbA/DsbL [Rhodanobacter sp. Col0626]|uniref:thiol:disulfide interchange protein DsbA/DsbL n=1 Tax=Rhodanobacter sp. Col0626 TaxID=3415679 RepID=UPI003CEFD864